MYLQYNPLYRSICCHQNIFLHFYSLLYCRQHISFLQCEKFEFHEKRSKFNTLWSSNKAFIALIVKSFTYPSLAHNYILQSPRDKHTPLSHCHMFRLFDSPPTVYYGNAILQILQYKTCQRINTHTFYDLKCHVACTFQGH